MPPKKLSPRQMAAAELRACRRMDAADRRAAAKSLRQISAALKREVAQIDKAMDKLQHQSCAAQTRSWREAIQIQKALETQIKTRARRAGILESRLATL